MENYSDLLAKFGKYKTGKGCLHVNKVAGIYQDVLRELVAKSAEHVGKDSGG